MFMKLLRTLMAAGLVLSAGQIEAAPSFTFTTPDFALPAFAGNGLLGSVWSRVPVPLSPQPPLFSFPDRNVGWARGYMASHTPAAVFVSTSVDYPQGAENSFTDSGTIAEFLGADAQSLSRPAVGADQVLTQNDSSDPVIGTLLRLTGYYRVEVAGSVFFNIGSDDGSDLEIQGQTIALLDGIRDFSTLASPVEVAFTTPGLYALRIDWFDGQHNQAGLLFGTGSPISPIGESLLYFSPLPEPASLPLFGIGFLALAMLRRRKPQA